MISRVQRLKLFDFCVLEKRCPICSQWPRAERPLRRKGIDVVPIAGGICARCAMAFVKNISVVTDSQEELDAWKEAVREERKKLPASRRHGQEILDEIRSKAAVKQQ
jgi:hypothetical protein